MKQSKHQELVGCKPLIWVITVSGICVWFVILVFPFQNEIQKRTQV